MKKALVSFALLLVALGAQAKDIKTLIVTTNPQMHCASCENKIKGNLRFEKGIKTIETNVKEQRVTITYDAEKTSSDVLVKAFEKIGYKATPVDAKVEKQQKAAPKKSK